MLWSKSHCSDESLSCPAAPCIKTQLLKLPLTTINGNDSALSVLFSLHCSGGTTGFKFTLINCFQVLWKRRKINQAEYQDGSERRLPLNTISKCERLHLKLIATPRLFRKIWQEKLQREAKQNNNKEREKRPYFFLRKSPYHFHTGGQHHLGCINTAVSQAAAVSVIFCASAQKGGCILILEFSFLLVWVVFFVLDGETEGRRGEISRSPSWPVIQLAIEAMSPTSAFHTPPTQHSPQLGKAAVVFYV